MGGDLGFGEAGGLAGVHPPLAGEGDETDEHLAVEGRGVGVEAAAGELGGEEALHARGDAGQDGGERRRLGGGVLPSLLMGRSRG